MTEPAIDTEGVVIEETKERLRPEDIPTADIPAYTVAGAVEWMRRPENEVVIRNWADSVGAKWKAMVAAIDRDVSKTGRLVVDMCRDESVLEDVKNSFLASLIGE